MDHEKFDDGRVCCHYEQTFYLYFCFFFKHFLSINYEMIGELALAHYLSKKVIFNVH